MGGGGGGAWKVAYADFVTAMMAFFMVMWLTSQKPEVKEALAEYFSDPWAKYRQNSNTVRKPSLMEPKPGENPPRKNSMGSRSPVDPHDDAEWPTATRPRVTTVRAPERTTIGTTVHFQSGSDELLPDSELRLKKLVPQLKGLPQKIEIRGHTSVQAATNGMQDDDSWKLSFSRCMRVLRFLESEGVEADRMRPSPAAHYEPIVVDQNPNEEDKNSRVEIFLLAETVESLKGSKPSKGNTQKKPKDPDEQEMQHWLEANDPASKPKEEKKGH